jgi:hypothetical protein
MPAFWGVFAILHFCSIRAPSLWSGVPTSGEGVPTFGCSSLETLHRHTWGALLISYVLPNPIKLTIKTDHQTPPSPPPLPPLPHHLPSHLSHSRLRPPPCSRHVPKTSELINLCERTKDPSPNPTCSSRASISPAAPSQLGTHSSERMRG